MVRWLYASYTTRVYSTLPKGKKPLARPRLAKTRVRGQQVDILDTTICQILFGQEFSALRSTAVFNYRVGQTKVYLVKRDLE